MSAKVYYLDRVTGSINPHSAGHAPASAFERLMQPDTGAALDAMARADVEHARDYAPLDGAGVYAQRAGWSTREALQAVSERAVGVRGRDVAGDGVQAWSKGAIYPAIIAIIERDGDASTRQYELTFQGHAETYATWEDAEMVARALISSPEVAAQWGAA